MGSKYRQGQNGVGLIQSLKKGTGFLCALIVGLVVMRSQGQGMLQITFDGPPLVRPGTAISVQQYSESGMSFVPLGFTFGRIGASPQGGRPDNGTAYVQAAFTQSLAFSFTDGTLFDLFSADLAEYGTGVPGAVTVRFVGYRFDGSTVTTDLTTDGVIDGTGPLADFQTFNFGSEWSGLSRIEIPTIGWSLDNLVVSIPESGTWALLILGGVLACCRFWKRWRKH